MIFFSNGKLIVLCKVFLFAVRSELSSTLNLVLFSTCFLCGFSFCFVFILYVYQISSVLFIFPLPQPHNWHSTDDYPFSCRSFLSFWQSVCCQEILKTSRQPWNLLYKFIHTKDRIHFVYLLTFLSLFIP